MVPALPQTIKNTKNIASKFLFELLLFSFRISKLIHFSAMADVSTYCAQKFTERCASPFFKELLYYLHVNQMKESNLEYCKKGNNSIRESESIFYIIISSSNNS